VAVGSLWMGSLPLIASGLGRSARLGRGGRGVRDVLFVLRSLRVNVFGGDIEASSKVCREGAEYHRGTRGARGKRKDYGGGCSWNGYDHGSRYLGGCGGH